MLSEQSESASQHQASYPAASLAGRLRLHRMIPRDAREPNRSSSALELFFDLVFVVVVSFSSGQLHHMELNGNGWAALGAYLMVFFTIWWVWMNFCWFSTSFAVDDWLYRVMTLAQMGGMLVLAAGIELEMRTGNLTIAAETAREL